MGAHGPCRYQVGQALDVSQPPAVSRGGWMEGWKNAMSSRGGAPD